jgi:S-formylglutathione hydrolase FrmB
VRTTRLRLGSTAAVAAAVVAACAALAAIALAATRRPSPEGAASEVTASFESEALASPFHFAVYLPPGYATSGKRYPVVYFLHGLPAGPTSYLQLGWVARALDSTGRGAILVVPQGTRRANGDPEYHDWGVGHDWETALAVELPDWIDSHYRTIASRSGRAIVGVSAGGYGAAVIGLHRPAEYAVVESWSGYFRPTDPTGRTPLDVGSDADNAYANVRSLVPGLAAQFARYPTLFAFYVGAGDPTFVDDNTALDRALTAARVPHLFRLYPGGHSAALWKAHAAAWLELALDRLAS